MTRVSRRAASLALASLVALAARSPAAAGPEVGAAVVEREFAAAIRKVTPATVVCLAKGAAPGQGGSSGVLVSKDGYVLSDGDANVILTFVKDKPPLKRSVDDVEVRVPESVAAGKPPSSHVYAAKVVRRPPDDSLDSCLLKITSPPPSGFPFVTASTADDLRVGAYTFAVGNSFGSSQEGTPTLTAGIVSALVPAAEADAIGRHKLIYTSAAVNPGVNGGPLVDAEGMLVGVISTWAQATEDDPFQFLGKVIPIDRVRAAYKDLPQAAAAFPDPKTLPPKSKQSEMVERAYEAAARRAYPCVASLEFGRANKLVMKIGERGATMPRYLGPTSAVVVSADGYLVTALYNLANTLGLAMRGLPIDVDADLKGLTDIVAHFPDGHGAKAVVVAHDQRLGIALLKADVTGYALPLPEAAPPESFAVGRTVLCVANPFGHDAKPDPFVTAGIVSRIHPANAAEPWRGDFQTDAGVTDGNAGGALVDLRGRILGIATTWDPAHHGRNSGIGFGIPWDRIQQALPSLQAGTCVRAGYLGVTWEADAGALKVLDVKADSPVAAAGLLVGDRVLAIDGRAVRSVSEAINALLPRAAGETVKLTCERAGKRIDLEVVLGVRPGA